MGGQTKVSLVTMRVPAVMGIVNITPDSFSDGGRFLEPQRAIDHGFGKPMTEALAVERASYESVLTSQDRNEGLRAFAEKRAPRYQGK